MIIVTLVNLPGSYLSTLYGISDILGYANDLSGSIFDVSIRDPDDFVRHLPHLGTGSDTPFPCGQGRHPARSGGGEGPEGFCRTGRDPRIRLRWSLLPLSRRSG